MSFLLISFKLSSGCLFRPHQVMSRRLTRKSLFTSPTLLKSLSGDTEVAESVRCCLVIRTNRGNSYTCSFHHIRGSLSRDTSPRVLRQEKKIPSYFVFLRIFFPSFLVHEDPILLSSVDTYCCKYREDVGNTMIVFHSVRVRWISFVKFQILFVINY